MKEAKFCTPNSVMIGEGENWYKSPQGPKFQKNCSSIIDFLMPRARLCTKHAEITLISHTFGRLTGGKNTEKLQI